MSDTILKKKSKLKESLLTVKEKTPAYTIPPVTPKYKEDIYFKIKNQNLILFGIYSILKKKETCTCERLVAECFLNFPKIFGFMRYPQ